MQPKIIVVLLLALLFASCEPFMLSLFPGYLPDLVVSADLTEQLRGTEVERYHFSVMYDGTRECVFLLVYFYNGDKRLLAFNDSLHQIHDETFSDFGSRCFVDASGNFIVGTRSMDFAFLPTSSDSLGLLPSPGSDGFGCVIDGNNFILKPNGYNTQFDDYTNAWVASTDNDADLQNNMYSSLSTYQMVYARSFTGLDLTSLELGSTSATVLILRDNDDNNHHEGFAVLIEDNATFPVAGNTTIIGAPSPFHTIRLGPIEYDAWVMSAGIVYRALDGSLKLRLWNGELAAETRDISAEDGDLLMDYGFRDNYYIFDTDTKKLFKARNWWLK